MPSAQKTPDQPGNVAQSLAEEEKPSSAVPDEPRFFHLSCGRTWLIIFALAMVLGMIVGIIFIAHQYYKEFGGQGFLKARAEKSFVAELELYLPLRKIKTSAENIDPSSIPWQQLGENVPYFKCGDQQHSCQRQGQPNVCCPVKMVCHQSKFTPSKVVCCNSTKSTCGETSSSQIKCLPFTNKCPAATGGGCCPQELICSPNGCVDIRNASIIESSSIQAESTAVSTTILTGAASTVTQSPASTATYVKDGEVSQQEAGAKKSILMTSYIPYISAAVLMCVTAVMGFL